MLAAILTLGLAATPARAEWDHATCTAAVAEMRTRVAALPVGDLSRRFAEHDLDTALIELAAGDGDECEERIRRADDTVTNRRYVLRPDEVLKGYGPDDSR